MVMRDGELAAIVGTMGGDAQPQIVAQLLARLLHNRQSPATAIGAPRWALRGPRTGFDTWGPTPPTVTIEAGAPASWIGELARRVTPWKQSARATAARSRTASPSVG